MLLFYVIYCIALHFNSSLEKWAMSLNLPIKLPTKEEQSALVTYKNIPDSSYTQGNQQQVTSLSQDTNQQQQATTQQQTGEYQGYTDPNAAWDPNSSWDPNAAWGDETTTAAQNVQPVADNWGGVQNTVASDWGANAWNQDQGQQNYGYNVGVGDPAQPETTTATTTNTQETGQKPQVGQPPQPEYYKSKDPKSHELTNPLEKPVDGGILAQISWAVVYPIHYMCRLTMPDCRTEKYRNWYPFTFLISMIWISFYSYFMVCIYFIHSLYTHKYTLM